MGTSIRDQMLQAQELIKQKRYAEARAILVTIDHQKAREWIAHIDQLMTDDLDLPSLPKQGKKRRQKEKSGGPGCFKIGLGIGCVAPGAFCVGLIVIIAIVAALVQQQQEDVMEKALERNGGLGAFESPIAAQSWVDFTRGNIRATRIVRPADEMVENFNTFNDEPAEGANYVLVWFELLCESETCSTAMLGVDFKLTTPAGDEYDETLFATLDDDLDREEAIKGGTIEGWQVFEFPSGETIQTIRIEWGDETLHVNPPA